MRSWPSSPLDAAERAFELLTCPPPSLYFDGTTVAGLPSQHVPLPQLRRILLAPAATVSVRDGVWRHLVSRARSGDPSWVVAAVGMALPGLRRAAGQLTAGWPGEPCDVDTELLIGFLQRLHTIDLDAGRICGRLIDAAVRAARRVRDQVSAQWRLHDGVVGPCQPRLPWDHPDWVLVRAVAAGVLDPGEAELIGATRLGNVSVAEAAQALDIGVALAAKRRQRAEIRLRDAIAAGRLQHAATRAGSASQPVGQRLAAGTTAGVETATQQRPLDGTTTTRIPDGVEPPGSRRVPAGNAVVAQKTPMRRKEPEPPSPSAVPVAPSIRTTPRTPGREVPP